MMHTKPMVAGSKWAVVGSASIGIRSEEIDRQHEIGLLDALFARQMAQVFLADLESAPEIGPGERERRGTGQWMLERFCVLAGSSTDTFVVGLLNQGRVDV